MGVLDWRVVPTALVRQTGRYFAAQQFLTRLPCPSWTPFAPADLSASLAFFPLVGAFVGSIAAVVVAIVCGVAHESAAFGAVTAVAAGAIVTGAFHEDAVADVCDAFGAMSAQRRREIMRDSRVGSFGALGVAVLVVAKVAILSSMPWRVAAAALILGHVVARWTALPMTLRSAHVDDAASLTKPYVGAATPTRALFATLVPTAPLAVAILGPVVSLGLLASVLVLCALFARFFARWVGGLTGDCLGFVNQVAEVLTYAVVAQPTVANAVLHRLT